MVRWLGRGLPGNVSAQPLDFPRQVPGEMPLEQTSGFRIRVEVALERGRLPPDDACGRDRQRIDVSHRTGHQQRRAHEISRSQLTENMIVFGDLRLAVNEERDVHHGFAALYQSLAGSGRHPGSYAEHLQNFPRRQIAEDHPANLFFFSGQLDGTALDEKAPRLEDVDDGEQNTPSKGGPQRRRLEEKIRNGRQRGSHGEHPQPQNVTSLYAPSNRMLAAWMK